MLQQNEFRNTVFGPFIAHILNPSYCSQVNAMNSCIQQQYDIVGDMQASNHDIF